MKTLIATIIAALLAVGFVVALIGWQRWSSGRAVNAAQRVLKNSSFSLLSQFAIKGLDFLFALYMLRALGAAGAGEYRIAVTIWLLLKTFTDFGLGTRVTQEIAAHTERAGVLLGRATLLRLVLLFAFAPPFAVYLGISLATGGIGRVETLTIAVLALSILPTTYTDSATSVFNGQERFEIPAAVAMLGAVIGLGLRVAVLMAGWGPVGLALVALVANLLTAIPIILIVQRLGVRPEWSLSRGAATELLRAGWPLLVNALLASLFFQVDVIILRPLQGEAAVGLYGVSYQIINTLLIVSSTFTLALFPQLTRQATTDRAALTRTYILAVRVLLLIALPAATAITLLAPEIVRLIAGAGFLPGAADALRLTIWLLPFSFVNGVTQYVLIALGMQRRMTWAFAVTVVFNIAANLVFVPLFSYRASAALSVLSEVVLLVPFAFWVGQSLAPVPLLRVSWQPAVASAALALTAWAIGWRIGAGVWVGVSVGIAVYVVALLALGTFGPQERALARRLVSGQ